jgi:hypothetical protein
MTHIVGHTVQAIGGLQHPEQRQGRVSRKDGQATPPKQHGPRRKPELQRDDNGNPSAEENTGPRLITVPRPDCSWQAAEGNATAATMGCHTNPQVNKREGTVITSGKTVARHVGQAGGCHAAETCNNGRETRRNGTHPEPPNRRRLNIH